MFGPPGAGKGTQSDKLVKEFNLLKISTGDLLRNEIKNKTILGTKIKLIIDQGKFVSDDIINDLVSKIIPNKKFINNFIFDGYPRNLTQIKHLDNLLIKNNQKISCVLSLKISKEAIFKRITGRQVCSKCGLVFNKFFNPANQETHKCGPNNLKIRSDDNKNVIENRYETYTKQTLPILNYYQNQKLLHEIDGMLDIASIYQQIRRIMHSLET